MQAWILYIRCRRWHAAEMKRPGFYFIEPSKVRTYHITLIDGYLAAIVSSTLIVNSHDVIFCACKSLFDNLSVSVRGQLTYEPIPVIDQDKHHVVRKSLLEFFVSLRYLLRLRQGDIAFFSCMIPTALLMLEIVNRVLRKKNIFVVIHGEIEAIFAPERLSRRSIGYWALKWLHAHSRDSSINVVVIDDFIKATLSGRYPDRFPNESIFVVHHPITAATVTTPQTPAGPAACFIGYRTPAKGFDDFKRLSVSHPNIRFLAIGAGKIEDIRSGFATQISGGEQFSQAISQCSIAIFPYKSAYDCSLSAAALDALSAGVHIVATDRASFVGLSKDLGTEYVTTYRSTADLGELLKTPGWIAERQCGRSRRLALLASSKFGLGSVRNDFERIVSSVFGNTV